MTAISYHLACNVQVAQYIWRSGSMLCSKYYGVTNITSSTAPSLRVLKKTFNGFQESDRSTSVLPQLNHENKMYEELQSRVKYYLATGEASPAASVPVNVAKTVTTGTKLSKKRS